MSTGALKQRLGPLREELRNNLRLRWGVSAIVLILLVYLLLVLSDWRQQLHDQYQQRTAELYKMALLSGQEQWISHAQQANALRRALDAEIPATTSLGLAQAEVQNSLGQILKAFGDDLSTNAQSPVEVAGEPGLWRIPVTVNGEVTPRLLLEILRRIEGNQRLLVIEQFSLVFQRDRPLLQMTVVAYYRIGQSKGAKNAAP